VSNEWTYEVLTRAGPLDTETTAAVLTRLDALEVSPLTDEEQRIHGFDVEGEDVLLASRAELVDFLRRGGGVSLAWDSGRARDLGLDCFFAVHPGDAASTRISFSFPGSTFRDEDVRAVATRVAEEMLFAVIECVRSPYAWVYRESDWEV